MTSKPDMYCNFQERTPQIVRYLGMEVLIGMGHVTDYGIIVGFTYTSSLTKQSRISLQTVDADRVQTNLKQGRNTVQVDTKKCLVVTLRRASVGWTDGQGF